MTVKQLLKLIKDPKLKKALQQEAKHNLRLKRELERMKKANGSEKGFSPFLIGAILGVARGIQKAKQNRSERHLQRQMQREERDRIRKEFEELRRQHREELQRLSQQTRW